MRRKYSVAVIPNPQSPAEKKFDLDALTFLNMLEGMSYNQAKIQAKEDIKQLSTLT